MECPTCRVASTTGPYRGSGQERQVTMQRQVHSVGVAYDECPACGGIFIDKAALTTIEHAAKAKATPGQAAALAFKRSYEAAVRPEATDETRHCPRCRDEMFERPWAFATAVKIDVCIECDGVWLDPGELEDLEG